MVPMLVVKSELSAFVIETGRDTGIAGADDPEARQCSLGGKQSEPN